MVETNNMAKVENIPKNTILSDNSIFRSFIIIKKAKTTSNKTQKPISDMALDILLFNLKAYSKLNISLRYSMIFME